MPKRSSKKSTTAKQGKRSAPKKTAKKGSVWEAAAEAKRPGPQPPERLQRLLASAGYGSRRQCEELIENGRVTVDGELVTKLGKSASMDQNKIHVDGVLLRRQKKVYYAVNKPTGVVTTNRDPHGRPRVIDLVPRSERVFPIGRLDLSSEGLILLTNDGDLAQQLAHPKYAVRKIYRVTVAGKVEPETMRKMRTGIYIAEGLVSVDGARILKARPRATELEIVLREGKNREIRRILARMGHKVQKLRRIAIGPLRLGEVPTGAYRIVSREEVRKLQADAEASRAAGEAAALADPRKKRASKRAATKSTYKGTKKGAAKKTASTEAPKRGTGTGTGTRGTGTGTGTRGTGTRGRPTDNAAAKRGKSKSQFDIKLPGFEKDYDSGAVIGGDAAEQETPQRRAAKKGAGKRSSTTRGSTTRSTGKRSSTRATSTRQAKKKPAKKRGKKKSTGAATKRGATTGGRGRTRTSTKSTPGKGKKSVGRKRKR